MIGAEVMRNTALWQFRRGKDGSMGFLFPAGRIAMTAFNAVRFKVKPGRYRVQVTLLQGESIIRQPGVLNVNRSDVDAHADFIIGSVRTSRPRTSTPAERSLGSPTA